MKPSRAAVIVPAAGPKRRVFVNIRVSVTEILDVIPGILTVNDPVSIVSEARISHS